MAWTTGTIPMPQGDSAWDGDVARSDPGSWTLDLADATPAVVDARLRHGRGFVVVSGFPVDDRDAACARYTALAAGLGSLLPQNTAGDLLHLVQTRDGGTDRAYGSRGSGELLFHTDQAAAAPDERPRVFGLLCLGRAATGGHTQLVSGHALLSDLLGGPANRGLLQPTSPALGGRAPAQQWGLRQRSTATRDKADLSADVLRTSTSRRAAALLTPLPFGRDPDGVSDAPPVLAPMVEPAPDERPALRFNRYFLEVGSRVTGTELPAEVVDLVDAADAVLARGHLVHQLLLEPGQAAFIDNLTVLHNRTAYEDGDGHRRCLARVWVR